MPNNVKSTRRPAAPLTRPHGRAAGFRTKVSGVVAALLMLCTAPGQAQAQNRDLLELYRLAKVKDPLVSRSEARLASGRAEKDIARAALLPRISANASIRQFWTTVLYNDKKSPRLEGEYTGYSYGAGGNVPLFNLPSYYQLSVADAGISSADAGIKSARQDLIVRLFDAYVRQLKAATDEKLYRDEFSRVGKVLEQAEAYLQAGTGDIIAVYEAKARLDSAAADLMKAEGQLELTRQNLALLAGVPVDSVRDIAVVTHAGPEPKDIDWWLDIMKQRNPALVQARQDVLQAEAGTRAATAGHLPTLQANGGYTADKGSTFLPEVETDQWYIGVGLTVPIYSGGDTAARTRRALAGEAERRAVLNDAQDKAIRRLKEAYLNLLHNVSLVDAYKRKYESSEMQLKAIQKGREIGTRTAIDLLNAEHSFAISRRDWASARYDNVFRQVELKAAAGILSEDEIVAINNQ